MSQNDGPSRHDPLGWTWVLLITLITSILLATWFWSRNANSFKYLALTCAYYLHFVQYPLIFLMSDEYVRFLHHIPNQYKTLLGTSYKDAYVPYFTACALRSIGILFAFLALPRAVYLWVNNDKLLFTRKLDLDSLIDIQRENYPRIKPATARNLLEEDERFGPWASHLNQIDLAIHRNLLRLESPDNIDNPLERRILEQKLEDLKTVGLESPEFYQADNEPVSYIQFGNLKFITANAQSKNDKLTTFMDNLNRYVGTLTINREQLTQYYEQTLGPRCIYTGRYIDINYLPPIERSIWVILMACVAQRDELRPKIEGLLDHLSDSFIEGAFNSTDHIINLDGILELYDSVKDDKNVKLELLRIARSHGYYYTAFTALYTSAKKKYGTIITRDFHFLKVTNRLLFFTLNQIGLEAPRPEASSVRCHYLAENSRNNDLGKAIAIPVVDSSAVNFIHLLYEEGWLAKPMTRMNEETHLAEWIP